MQLIQSKKLNILDDERVNGFHAPLQIRDEERKIELVTLTDKVWQLPLAILNLVRNCGVNRVGFLLGDHHMTRKEDEQGATHGYTLEYIR